MSVFTPAAGLLGGALIGASAGLLLTTNGDIMGISGIFRSSVLHPGNRWKTAFVSAFLLTAQLYRRDAPTTATASPTNIALVVGGACVGLGTQLGNGCTSGHGICGLARYSVRSLAAVLTFCGVGAAVASTIANTGSLQQVLRTTEPMLVNNLWGAAMVGVSVVMLLMTKQQSSVEGKKTVAALASGAVSSVGMSISGMSQVGKVLGFLEVSRLFGPEGGESWDPTLTMVMASGVVVSWLCYQLRPESPACAPEYSVPSNTVIDNSLIMGATLFGVGWAIAGLCPGPALWNAGAGATPVIMYWIPAFVAGSFAGESLR